MFGPAYAGCVQSDSILDLAISALVAFSSSLLAQDVVEPAASELRTAPSVVLLMADDLGWGDLGCQGHPTLRTPHLDAMAAAGLRFERFYAASPVCSPTRASCLTGRYPERVGILGANHGHLPAGEDNLARVLARSGYATGHFGKWHLGTMTRETRDSNRGGPRGVAHYAPPWDRGFEVCFSTEAKVPTFDPMVHPESGEAYGTAYWVGEERRAEGDLSGDDSRLIMDRALRFIGDAVEGERPFFAVVWFHAPHLPCVASEADRAPYAGEPEPTQHYYGCISALDRQVGRLRARLRTLGVADNTMVWFCSDNGPEGAAGRAPGSTGGLRGRKRMLFEGGIRVPGIVEWPAVIEPGTATDVPAWTCDYFPTIVAATGASAEPAGALDGVDLGPVLRGGELEPRDLAFRYRQRRALIRGNAKVIEDRGVRHAFDLGESTDEREELADDAHPGLWSALRAFCASLSR